MAEPVDIVGQRAREAEEKKPSHIIWIVPIVLSLIIAGLVAAIVKHDEAAPPIPVPVIEEAVEEEAPPYTFAVIEDKQRYGGTEVSVLGRILSEKEGNETHGTYNTFLIDESGNRLRLNSMRAEHQKYITLGEVSEKSYNITGIFREWYNGSIEVRSVSE